jgi:hypothetical protein
LQLGGRLQQIKVNKDVSVDLGGSIYHISVNPNVVDVREQFIMKMLKTQDNYDWKEAVELINIYDDIESFGIWDGKRFVYLGPRKSPILSFFHRIFDKYLFNVASIGSLLGYINKKMQKISTLVSMFSTYGFSTLRGITKFKDTEGKNFCKLFQDYNCHDYYEAYIKYLPPHLVHTNGREFLTDPANGYNVSSKFLSQVIEPVTRNIYSQNLDQYHALAMVTTVLSGDSSKLRTFKNGNGAFFEAVAKSIGPKHSTIAYKTEITSIELVKSLNLFLIILGE